MVRSLIKNTFQRSEAKLKCEFFSQGRYLVWGPHFLDRTWWIQTRFRHQEMRIQPHCISFHSQLMCLRLHATLFDLARSGANVVYLWIILCQIWRCLPSMVLSSTILVLCGVITPIFCNFIWWCCSAMFREFCDFHNVSQVSVLWPFGELQRGCVQGWSFFEAIKFQWSESAINA